MRIPRCLLFLLLFPFTHLAGQPKRLTVSTATISLSIEYGDKACISSLVVHGQKVLSGADGAFTSVRVGENTYSSLHLKGQPIMIRNKDTLVIGGIEYGDATTTIR